MLKEQSQEKCLTVIHSFKLQKLAGNELLNYQESHSIKIMPSICLIGKV